MTDLENERAVFRPRLSVAAWPAIFTTVIAYGLLKFAIRPDGLPGAYPFGVAALVGLGMFALRVSSARKQGLELDANGIRALDGHASFAWTDITAIEIDIENHPVANNPSRVRVATLRAGHAKLRFADFGPGNAGEVNGIYNLEGAAAILAIAAEKTDSAQLFPESWQQQTSVQAEARADAEPVLQREVATSRWRTLRAAGVVALAVKLVPQLAKVAVKLFKTIKPGAAVVTVAAYSLVFSWEFALALVVMILVHECGHVFAMWRSGVPVKGIYLIPFMGGVAMGEGTARSRRQDAFIAINGPVFGAALALACWAASAALGQGPAADFFAAAAAWGALINLFNLLPIFPLDGGRIVASVVHGSPAALPLVFASLALGGLFAYFAQLELLFLIAFVGLLELGEQVAAVPYRPALALLPSHRRLTPPEHEHFSRFVAPVEKGRNSDARVAARARAFEQRSATARQRPMTVQERLVALGGYAALFAGLLYVLFALSDVAGAGDPLSFIR